MIRDSHNRLHNYLRISLTDNCNLRCFYCMPDEDYAFTPASQLMQVSEIAAIARIFVREGINKIRLTGGEPLVRKDAAEIIRVLAALPAELTLTTNGTRLHLFKDVLKECSVRSVNISLDTLQADKFTRITRRPQFEQVMRNIEELLGQGFNVKVNVVVMKGVNDDELLDFVAWTRLVPVHVRFIEFMPFSGNRWSSNQVVTLDRMLQAIAESYEYIPLPREEHGTAKKYQVPGHAGTFAVISTMSSHFCGDCNRLRLTADGKLKNCLFSRDETDLLAAFREGLDILPLIRRNVRGKAAQLGGQLIPEFENLPADRIENRSMITIGG